MSGNTETTNTPLNALKWLLAVAFAGGAIVGNQMYAEVGLLYRILGVVALMLVALGVAALTAQGKAFLVLLKEANIERRKVVWPTRQETTQTTMIVVAVVILMSLVLWGVDSLLSWLISLLLG